ncbi:MAG: hypothetical protein WBB37_07570 [bacterium]
MITDKDKEWIKDNSKEIIEGSGELITRKRLKTVLPPDSYDSDFGEVVKESEELYDTIEFRGKVFWDVTEQLLQETFGADKNAEAIVHIPDAMDVKAEDILVIRGLEYELKELKEAPLRGMKIAGIIIKSAQ